MKVQFSVMGSCTQTIQLKSDCPYTPEEIIDGLNGHGDLSVCTTVQEGGQVILFGPDERVLGIVESSDVDAEYADFEIIADDGTSF